MSKLQEKPSALKRKRTHSTSKMNFFTVPVPFYISVSKKFFFFDENCYLLISRPPKKLSKLQEKPSALKKEHTALFIFLRVILALLDPDPKISLDPDPEHAYRTLTLQLQNC
jgi:hypothetical protein